MERRKATRGKIYPEYRPYPVSFGSEGKEYSSHSSDDLGITASSQMNGDSPDDLHNLISDPVPDDFQFSRPIDSNDGNSFRPLHLLQSLFADRLNFLQRSLDELEEAKKERKKLVQYALDELDPEILKCEQSLSAKREYHSDPEHRRHLERRLRELTRERRRETLLGWRDLVWLRGEIRKLQREIDSIGKTPPEAQNREPPL